MAQINTCAGPLLINVSMPVIGMRENGKLGLTEFLLSECLASAL